METGERFWKILDNSYRNFHKVGFDYVNLQRTEMFTLKAYFFDEDHNDIVMPHTHRYDFTSTVLHGELLNRRYEELPYFLLGERTTTTVNKFIYFTPLNGGEGFKFCKEVPMIHMEDRTFKKGQTCSSNYTDIHTISVKAGTVLLLTQFQDQVGLDEATLAYRFDSKEPPSLDGLYESFKPSQLMERLSQLEQLGIRF